MRIVPKLSRRWEILLDSVLVFLLSAVVIRPLFKAGYFDKWGSIEGAIVADARFLIDHWWHPQWQPLWYAGTRFDYVYPPAVRYGTAILAMLTGFAPVRAYHIYLAFFYCVGMAGVYLLVRVATASRGMSWLCAAATALMSPSFLFLTPLRHDAWMLMPERLGVLAKYGEGPHMTALALIPFALAAAWLALERWRPAMIAVAALCAAAVVANDLYGAVALAMFYAILVWSFWITRQDKRIAWPAVMIPVLTAGLTALWLAPSYFTVTAENLRYLSEHGTTWSIWIALALAIVFALATDRFARGKTDRTWVVFATGCAIFFSLNVLGNYYFSFRIYGEPLNMAAELDLVYILFAATILRWLWSRTSRAPRVAAAVIAAAAFATTLVYLRHAWQMFPLGRSYQSRVEYRISDWLAKNMPDARTAESGSVRLWLDVWHDLPQLGGGSDLGLMNIAPQFAHWELLLGPKPEASILWMQCLGVDAIYVSDKSSEEMYKEIRYPQKFEGSLPVVFDDHAGNRIYQVPRRYPARARVVETARLNALQIPRSGEDVRNLRAYADVVEKGPDSPVTVVRPAADSMEVRAKLAAGESIVVQESYDPAWHAWSDGREMPIRKDVMNFMVVDAPPGDRDVRFVFAAAFEDQAGRGVSVIALLVVIGLGVGGRRKAAPPETRT